LAKGGVGLIITSIAGVYSKALAPERIIRADNDEFTASLRKIAQAVHEAAPDCSVVLQLYHPER